MLRVATLALTTFGPLLVTTVHGVTALTVDNIIARSFIGRTLTQCKRLLLTGPDQV